MSNTTIWSFLVGVALTDSRATPSLGAGRSSEFFMPGLSGRQSCSLKATAARMSTLIRPAMEWEIFTLLQQPSEGRFTAVKVSDKYDITVEDDGAFQPLTEFSGG